MTNAELIQKIRAEIERRMKEYDGKTGDIETARRLTYLDVLSFLDTLESEKPIEGLEEEIKRYGKEEMPVVLESDLNDIARHFAEWGYLRAAEKYNEIEYNRQRAEESVPNDLEEAASDSWALYEYRESPRGLYSTCYVDGFKAGAEWAMDQLPKWRESSKEYYTDKPKVYEGFGQFKLFWKDRVIDLNKVFETLPKK